MIRFCLTILYASWLFAQDPSSYIDLPGRPMAQSPIVAEQDGANAIFDIGPKQIVLENLKFRKPWIGTWQISFTAKNMTEHHLENVVLAFGFVSKTGFLVSDPKKFSVIRIPDFPDSPSKPLPFTINIPSDLRPEKSKDAETVRPYLISFKARMNEGDLAAVARERDRKEREERLAALKAAQEKADAEAIAQHAKEELERAETDAASKKANALKAAEAARRKQQELLAQSHPKDLGQALPQAVTNSIADDKSSGGTSTLAIIVPIVLIAFLLAVVFAYSNSSASRARLRARGALETLEGLDHSIKLFQGKVRQATELAVKNYVNRVRASRLRAISVEELKNLAPGVRLTALRSSGISNLADLQGRSANSLLQIKGIGPDSASRIASAAARVIDAMNRHPIPIPWLGELDQADWSIFNSIYHMNRGQIWFNDPNDKFQDLLKNYRDQYLKIKDGTTFSNWLINLFTPCGVALASEMADLLQKRLEERNDAGQVVQGLKDHLEQATTEFDGSIKMRDLAKEMELHTEIYKSQLSVLISNMQGPVKDQPKIGGPLTSISIRSAVVIPERTSIFESKSALPKEMGTTSDSPPVWIPKGEEVKIGSFLISGGMIYLGSGSSANGGQREASLIDPKLSIQASAADCRNIKMGYWPRYEAIGPEARASYLDWLATGKANPLADIGYVFLYFYGLERRVLVDAKLDPLARAEFPTITAEVARLLNIYTSGSFFGYATSLLDFIRAESGMWEEFSPSNQSPTHAMSFSLKVAIGKLSKEGKPIGVDLAYAWYRSDPTTRRLLPMQRCPELFMEVFTTKFRKEFPQGLKVPENKTKLKLIHRPANASLTGGAYSIDMDLPDVSVLGSPIQKLQRIGDATAVSLEQYSRFIGKNPSHGKTLDAFLLMPREVWPKGFLDPIHALRREVEATGRPKLMKLLDLELLLPEGIGFTKSSYNSLCRALESEGLCLEPDVQYGGSVPEMADSLVLFEAKATGASSLPSPEFSGAALLLHLASAVAGNEGNVGEAEASLVLNHINQGLALRDTEIKRLEARLELFKRNPPPLTGLKKKVDSLDMTSKKAIGAFMVQVVNADGVVAPGEVRSLEKVFKLLGLDTSTLYSKIHGATMEPVPVRAASEEDTHFKVPRASKPADSLSPLKLDMAKVAALKEDSAKVSALLGAIFSDPQQSEPPPVDTQEEFIPPISSEMSGPLPTLDPAHSGLLLILLQRPEWSRAELEEICSDRGLMVDGAIERINEAAFEQYDQPMLEGNDPLLVNIELKLEIA